MKYFKKWFLCFVLGGVFFCPKLLAAPKVYDCFLFYNEFELLEVRLHELSDHVDKFVLVESCETFRGKPKKFYFEENKQLFEKYKDKIIHVKLTEPFKTEKLFERERYQRSQVLRGLKNAKPGDIVFISDLDEIIRGSKVAEVVKMITSKKAEAAILEQKMYYGFFNRQQADGWRGPVCTTYRVMKRISPALTRRLRNLRPKKVKKSKLTKIEIVPNAGWHFTSMGGVDRAILKIESFSHAELDTPEFKDKQRILAEMRALPHVPIDESFPLYVRENQERFKKLGFIDEEI
jgi:beta-1,4-mannosyl-glycoprotein beta-1,4-N-acetylglucosaminyltransferase